MTRVPAEAYTPGVGGPVPRHKRNPRRAYDSIGRVITPMTISNATENGALPASPATQVPMIAPMPPTMSSASRTATMTEGPRPILIRRSRFTTGAWTKLRSTARTRGTNTSPTKLEGGDQHYADCEGKKPAKARNEGRRHLGRWARDHGFVVRHAMLNSLRCAGCAAPGP